MSILSHLHRRWHSSIEPYDPTPLVEAEHRLTEVNRAYEEVLTRVEESAEVQQQHRFIRARNHLGPSFAEVYGKVR